MSAWLVVAAIATATVSGVPGRFCSPRGRAGRDAGRGVLYIVATLLILLWR